MFVDFAFHTHMDTGWRLVERCGHHALDPRGPQLLDTNARLFNYKGELVILLSNKIQPSMISSTYTVTAGVTKDDIIFLHCNCDSGGRGDQQVVCVHVLPVLYRLRISCVMV